MENPPMPAHLAAHTGVLSSLVGWSGDALSIVDAGALKRLDRATLSPSTMNDLVDSCPAKWAAKSLLPRDGGDPFAANELGTSTHSVHERFYSLPAHLRTRETLIALVDEAGQNKWGRDNPETLPKRVDWTSQILTLALPIMEMRNPAAVDVVSVEELLDGVQLRGIPLKGYIDMVERDAEGGLVIDDLKTGKPQTAEKVRDGGGADQQRIYGNGYLAKHGVMPVGANLMFPQANPRSRVQKIQWTRPAHSRTLDKFEKAWGILQTSIEAGAFPTTPVNEDGKFAGRPHGLCGWCPIRDACPVKVATPREGGTPWPDVASAEMLAIPTLSEHSPLPAKAAPVLLPMPTRRDHASDLDDLAASYGYDPVPAPATATAPEPTPAPVEPEAPVAEVDPDWVAHAQAIAAEYTPETDGQPHTLPWHSTSGDPTGPLTTPITLEKTIMQNGPTPLGLDHIPGYAAAEGKPWEARTTADSLDAADATTIALAGIEDMAYQRLARDGRAVSPGSIAALAATFAVITLNVQQAMHPHGEVGFDRAMNTRVRGLLHSVLDATRPDPVTGAQVPERPIPYEGDAFAWDAWTRDIARRMHALARGIPALRQVQVTDRPWEATKSDGSPIFATAAPVSAAA